MGKRGPKKTPTKTLKLRGSWRANDRAGEPAASGRAKKPTWLKKLAKKKWTELVPLLENMGVLAEIDSTVLARYCDSWAWWKDLRKTIEKEGECVTSYNKNGDEYVTQNPKVNIALKISAQLAKLESQMGMTPSARADLKTEPKENSAPEKRRFFA